MGEKYSAKLYIISADGSKAKEEVQHVEMEWAKMTSFQATSDSSGEGKRDSRLAPFNRKHLEGRNRIVLYSYFFFPRTDIFPSTHER